jgi:hypothetical protein
MTDYPNSPSAGSTFSANNIDHVYNGVKWNIFYKKYSYTGSVLTNISNITVVDVSSGNLFELNLSSSTTIQFSNPPASGLAQKFYLKLSINSNSVTITWPTSVTWESGSAPSLPTSGQIALLEFYNSDNGTTYYANYQEIT